MGNYFRVYEEMVNDPKMRAVAVRSKRRVCEVIAVFVHILTNASAGLRADDRGTLRGWHDDDIDIALDLEAGTTAAIRAAMQGRLLSGDVVTGWRKRQPIREDSSAERMRVHRQGARPEGVANNPADHARTRGDATERAVTRGDARGASPRVTARHAQSETHAKQSARKPSRNLAPEAELMASPGGAETPIGEQSGAPSSSSPQAENKIVEELQRFDEDAPERDVTHGDAIYKRRGDKKKREDLRPACKSSSSSSGDAIDAENAELLSKLKKAAPGKIGFSDVSPIRALVQSGCDLERDVLPVFREHVVKLERPIQVPGARWLRAEIEARARARAADADKGAPSRVFVLETSPDWTRCCARYAAEHDGQKCGARDLRGGRGWYFPVDWLVEPAGNAADIAAE